MLAGCFCKRIRWRRGGLNAFATGFAFAAITVTRAFFARGSVVLRVAHGLVVGHWLGVACQSKRFTCFLRRGIAVAGCLIAWWAAFATFGAVATLAIAVGPLCA